MTMTWPLRVTQFEFNRDKNSKVFCCENSKHLSFRVSSVLAPTLYTNRKHKMSRNRILASSTRQTISVHNIIRSHTQSSSSTRLGLTGHIMSMVQNGQENFALVQKLLFSIRFSFISVWGECSVSDFSWTFRPLSLCKKNIIISHANMSVLLELKEFKNIVKKWNYKKIKLLINTWYTLV